MGVVRRAGIVLLVSLALFVAAHPVAYFGFLTGSFWYGPPGIGGSIYELPVSINPLETVMGLQSVGVLEFFFYIFFGILSLIELAILFLVVAITILFFVQLINFVFYENKEKA